MTAVTMPPNSTIAFPGATVPLQGVLVRALEGWGAGVKRLGSEEGMQQRGCGDKPAPSTHLMWSGYTRSLKATAALVWNVCLYAMVLRLPALIVRKELQRWGDGVSEGVVASVTVVAPDVLEVSVQRLEEVAIK